MLRESKLNRLSPLAFLRLRWFLVLFSSAAALYLAAPIVHPGTPQQPISPLESFWVWGAALGLVAHLGVLWWGLKRNHRRNERELLPTLGYGNTITIIRGVLVSLLAGFLFIPEPNTLLAWLPAIFYSTASLLDYLDGYVARVTNHTTILGEVLDMEFDGLGLLIAIGVAIRYGQLPPWYLLLGLARQLFILGLWLRKRNGLPTYDLTPSENRRIIAGFQMGFVSVILWPILTPPLTTIVCLLFSVPLVASFGRDWLVVSGQFDPRSLTYIQLRGRGKQILEGWGPLLCRVAAVIISAILIWERWPAFAEWEPLLERMQPAWFEVGWRLVLGMTPLVVAALLLGFFSRFAALLLLPLAFSSLLAQGPGVGNVLLLSGLVWVLQFGGGQFCLWSPEEDLLRHRAGE